MPQILWLFDLDNTLHNAGRDIFPRIEQNMNDFLVQKLGQDIASVSAMRQLYWQRYGATVLGLIKHQGISAQEFLHPVHDIPELTHMLRYERGLSRLLRRLPGRKILLTNAPHGYAQRVLKHLGVGRHFERHIAIEAMHVHRQLRPKPDKLMLRRLLAREGKRAHNCILVEDSHANLRAAKALGLRTVWITQYLDRQHGKPSWIDVKVPSVVHLPRKLHKLR
ncbi:MAG: pyrimidine 5'-nucleotidase, partial [Burkholderiales bacterium]|nr:pyrimidine 5'-nucleotidase [Burkholderiales bacterium]